MRVESIAIPLLRQVVNRPRLAEVLFSRDRWGNPYAARFVHDPDLQVEMIRQDVPVVWRGVYQQWFVLGYAEAREVLGSSHAGTANQIEVLLDVSPYTKLGDRSRAFLSDLMLFTDPPRHTRLRALVNRAFTPRQVAGLEDRMTAIIDDLIADFGSGEIELMSDFAVPFPVYVITDLLGISHDDWPWVRQASKIITGILDPIHAFDPAEVDEAVGGLYERVVAWARDRRANPGPDLLTGLALAEADDGDRLTEAELVAVVGIILIAGHETTAGMFANSLIALADNPDQRALIDGRPDLWPNAVEELLRFDTSVRNDPRTALEDFELAGHRIKKGQNIIVLNHVANRDLRRFADADDLRLDRPDPAPISFGHGIHYCLGANLARAELVAGLPRLLDALGDYRIDKSRIEWRQSTALRIPDRLPINCR